jgi:hypothetical protein
MICRASRPWRPTGSRTSGGIDASSGPQPPVPLIVKGLPSESTTRVVSALQARRANVWSSPGCADRRDAVARRVLPWLCDKPSNRPAEGCSCPSRRGPWCSGLQCPRRCRYRSSACTRSRLRRRPRRAKRIRAPRLRLDQQSKKADKQIATKDHGPVPDIETEKPAVGRY